MRRKITKYLLSLLTGLAVLFTPLAVSAEGTANYCFGSGEAMNRKAPVAYEVERVYYATDLEGVTDLSNLASMFVKDDLIYVANGNMILVLDHDFNVVHILSEYEDKNGNSASINNPDGIFVTDEGMLYVCEPKSNHVLIFDKNYKLVSNFGKPSGLDISVEYMPSQIVVDRLNRMYIIATNIYEGILEINSENQFQRYFGTTTVSISAWDVFFRMIASEEQLNRQALVLPTEYTAMTLNEKGFIYTTIRTTDVKNPIRLLNVNGDDIMPEDWQENHPKGDFSYAITTTASAEAGPSRLTYIDCNKYGMYMVLDRTRNRIFTYDDASNMLYVFGGSGDRDGCFRNPVSVRWLGEENRKVLVADKLSQSITVMKPTNYANAIFEAVKLEAEGDRDTALVYWQEALDMNNNCSVAKDAIGRALYWAGDYKGSQEVLKRIHRNDYYSMSFEKVREELIRAYAPAAVAVLVALIVAVNVFRYVRNRRKGGNGYAKG